MALLAIGGYAVVTVIRLPGFLSAITWDSDFTAAMVLAERLASAHHQLSMTTGAYGYYSTIWFDLATHGLPFHRELWIITPFLLSLLGVALAALAAAKLAGRWAALLTAALLVAAGPALLIHLTAQAERQPTWFNSLLLSAFLAFAATRRMPLRARHWAMVGLVGVITGLNLASDPLMLGLAGVIPFALAGIFLPVVRGTSNRRMVTVISGCATLAALATAATTSALAHRIGFGTTPLPRGGAFASFQQIGSNLTLFIRGLVAVFGGEFFGQPFGLWSVLAWVCACMAVVALVLTLAAARRLLRRGDSDLSPADLVVAFWVLAVAGVAAAFIFSMIPEEGSQNRYLVVLFLAAWVVIPLLSAGWSGRGKVAIALASLLFAGVAAHSLNRVVLDNTLQARTTLALPGVMRVLEQKGLTRGYGPYWDANAVSWKSRMTVTVVAVDECPLQSAPRYVASACLHVGNNTIDTAPGPTFLLVDPDFWSGLKTLPTDVFGPPVRRYSVDRFTIFVYPYDIAERFPATAS